VKRTSSSGIHLSPIEVSSLIEVVSGATQEFPWIRVELEPHVCKALVGGGSMVDDSLSLAVLNTSAGPSAGWTALSAGAEGSAAGAVEAASKAGAYTPPPFGST
jgi:hypothetical protein